MRRWMTLGGASLIVLCGAWLLQTHAGSQAKPSATVFRRYLRDERARMVAYSPQPEVAADPQRLRQQLGILREKFDGLSLYQSGPETPAIVAAARSLGYRAVLLTVWDPRSESELATASSIVRDHANAMALAVSIGSEGLMEKRYTMADLRAARMELLQRSGDQRDGASPAVEMTTTEPWWLYLQAERRDLREFGDFRSINIHVVWDADITDPALAASWTRDRAEEVRQAVAAPVLIREGGLPGGGSTPRLGGTLSFNRNMQASYWKAWNGLQRRTPAVVFEGVDNPAKHWRDFEGSWGLFNTGMEPWPAWNVLTRIDEDAAEPRDSR